MPAKRIHALLPVPSSAPKMTNAIISATLITHRARHCSPSRSESITVMATKKAIPRKTEKIWTITYFVGLPIKVLPAMAITALRTINTP